MLANFLKKKKCIKGEIRQLCLGACRKFKCEWQEKKGRKQKASLEREPYTRRWKALSASEELGL